MARLAVSLAHRRYALGWLGWLGLVLLFLVWRAPAQVAAPWLEQTCRQHCRLVATHGSLWQGEGRLLWRTSLASGWHTLGTLQWEVRRAEESLLQPEWVVRLGRGEVRFVPAWQTLRIRATTLAFPAGWALGAFAAHAGAGLAARSWHGQVEIGHGRLDVPWAYLRGQRDTTLSGELVADWRSAGTALLPGLPLGDYRLEAATRPNGDWQARLATAAPAGQLAIHGSATLAHDGAVAIDLRATPTQPADAELTRLLSGFARRDAQGNAYRWVWPVAQRQTTGPP